MIHFQNRNRVANLVGLVLKGSKVEAHAPNEISKNRFELRCDCGSSFYALTGSIRGAESNKTTLSCPPCRKRRRNANDSGPSRVARAERRRVERCEHGFIVELDLCALCRAERDRPKVDCSICGERGHVSKRCPSTAVGRERIARAG